MQIYHHSALLDASGSGTASTSLAFIQDKRIVMLFGTIDRGASLGIIAELLQLDAQSHDEIQLVINSEGGSVYDGLAIIDVIRSLESPVITVVNGMAASMAAVIASSGKRRMSMPHSDFLVHQVIIPEAGGTLQDLRIQSAHAERTNRTVMAILAENCKRISHPEEQAIERADSLGSLPKGLRERFEAFIAENDRDHILTAQEAIRYGLIDEICPETSDAAETSKSEKEALA